MAEAHLLTDLSWAMALRGGTPRRRRLIGSGLCSLLAWTLGTAAGALTGRAVADYRVIGLDAALPTFFLCLLADRVKGRPPLVAVLGAGLALALTPVLPPGLPLLAGLVLAISVPPR